MTKTHKSFIILFIVTILVLLFFLKKYNDILKQDQLDLRVSKNIELINSEMSYQKKHALSLAILFSKDQNIINSLKTNNRNLLKKELNYLLNTLSNYSKLTNIQIQVHTKELKVFARSWEDKDIGLNLSSFRHGLVKVQQTQQPYVSNELGKRLNIKAISPIFDNGNYIGSIEVITDYTLLQKRLSLMGIELLPLLNTKFLNIATYHKDNQKLFDFILIDKNYNKQLYDTVHHNKEVFSFQKLYYDIDNSIITLIPIGNLNGEDLGYIVASFKKENQRFNYIPRYEYIEQIPNTKSIDKQTIEKQNIIIK